MVLLYIIRLRSAST